VPVIQLTGNDEGMQSCAIAMIGETIGNYVIRSKIGEGGMGAVYLAEHARLGRRVAVKVLLPHLGGSAEIVARFFNEAKAATDIKNEHIIDVLDFGELRDGSSYIVMEWLEGQSLADLLTRERLPIARTMHIARGIGEALAAAHARGIVHRDLKPDNIFLVTRGGDPDFVKVLDFGIAKLTLANAGDVRTQTGAMMGTPLYMAPEQIKGAHVDQRTDIYAMGIILYQMLTGVLPFQVTTLTDLLIAHTTQTPPPLRTHDPTIPTAVESVVLHALEKDPPRRFASVEELVRAFASASTEVVAPVSALASTAYAPSVTQQAARPNPNHALLALGGLGAVVLGLVTVVAVYLWPRSSPLEAASASAPIATNIPLASVESLASPTPVAEASSTPAPSPSTVASAPASTTTTVDRWTLVNTDCPFGAMPASVETTHKGNTIISHARGFPDAMGTTSADGTFHVHNAAGSCTGKTTARLVAETCTSNLNTSCHATYTRAD